MRAALLGRLEGSGSTKSFRIGEVFVEPDFQRQGLGSALMNHLEMQMAELGVCRITAATPIDSPAAGSVSSKASIAPGPCPTIRRNKRLERQSWRVAALCYNTLNDNLLARYSEVSWYLPPNSARVGTIPKPQCVHPGPPNTELPVTSGPPASE